MSFGSAIRSAFGKYATFSGRASRSEFWWFAVFVLLVDIVLYLPLVLMLPAQSSDPGATSGPTLVITASLLILGVFSLVVILPFLSVLVRRLHDTDRSGWWYWIVLVPFIGNIWLLVLLVLEGTPGANRFGPQP